MYMATEIPRTQRAPRKFRWTRAHLTRLPDDGNRYEVLDGELLVTPQARPGHQEIAVRLIMALRPYCGAHQLGTALGPGAVVFDDNELQPDVIVVPLKVGPSNNTWVGLPIPRLVVEVLSPGSERHDLVKKRDAYLRIGIPEYWVVDLDRLRVLVFRTGSDEPHAVTDTVRWQPVPDAPALEINITALLNE